ncbi:hypothetical protein [Mycolicibacterium brisbanense]|uniref:Uncharacterized protein n=1 Tax=Mycolicibacterium brisbanense TaxID=146020 RepID=A0A117I5R5_9MYCO|nr:hypothetical protein [Mycolicibacterium brisbanense]MCV7156137.1 hypothetical protein [Mycolicibacterium brisbanense]GAS88894.1 uncharacterized protein RMCB_2990 [Mycolicibacterium brisbanense]
MASWETWAQIAGVGGFIFGSYNIVRGIREPVRLYQRELRSKLRDVLYEVRLELEEALERMNTGTLGELPERLQGVHEQLRRISPGLISPAGVTMSEYTSDLYAAIQGLRGYKSGKSRGGAWEMRLERGGLRPLYKFREINTSPTSSELRDLLYKAVWKTSDLIDLTVRIDKGSHLTYRRYRPTRFSERQHKRAQDKAFEVERRGGAE